MNENPGETPNPLNNNSEPMPSEEPLDANPSEPLQDVNEPEEIIESVSVSKTESDTEKPEAVKIAVEEHTENQVSDPTPERVEIKEEQIEVSTEAPAPETNTTVESLDPTGRTMEKPSDALNETAPRKSKKGVIFAILGCIFLLGAIAAIVAAMMLTQKKTDPVFAAMQKIMSGNAPKNIAIDGDINILINNSSSPVKRINVDLDSDTVVGSMINTSSAVLTITDQSNNDYSAKFEEIYVSNDDLYFKISGASELLQDEFFLNLFTPTSSTTNCVADESGMTNCNVEVTDCVNDDGTDCIVVDGQAISSSNYNATSNTMTKMLVGLVEAADGKWIRISSDVLKQAGGAYVDTGSNISCITNLVSDVNKNSNSAIEIYNKYPFINSTDKNVIISKKQNPIFQVSVDSKNFTEYLNAIQNTELARSLNDCMGWSNNAAVTESDVSAIVQQMPNIYAEVDSDNNFTRLYLESDINNGVATATIDLGFSYPTNVNVSEPVEYTNYEDLIQSLFSGIYDNVQPSN